MTCVSVLTDNLRVLSAEILGVMKIWNAETGVTQLSILGPVGNLTLAPNGHLAISGNLCEHRSVILFENSLLHISTQCCSEYWTSVLRVKKINLT